MKVGVLNQVVVNLGNKSKYVFHYINLQLYLSLGMELTKVHRILEFKQCDWLKKYVDFNTGKRKNVRLVNNAGDYKKYVSKPRFVSQDRFNKYFVAIHKIKPV